MLETVNSYLQFLLQALCYKASFLALIGFGMFLLWRLRGNDLVGRDGAIDADLAFGQVFTVAMAILSYMLVQGSDPGYMVDGKCDSLCSWWPSRIIGCTTCLNVLLIGFRSQPH